MDGTAIELTPGMTVRHALLARYGTVCETTQVTDRRGNLVGLDGELTDGTELKTRPQAPT